MNLVLSGLMILSEWKSLDDRLSFGHLMCNFQKRHTSRNTDHTYKTYQEALMSADDRNICRGVGELMYFSCHVLDPLVYLIQIN